MVYSASRFLGSMVPFAHRSPLTIAAAASKAPRVIAKNQRAIATRIGTPLQLLNPLAPPPLNGLRVKHPNNHPQLVVDNACKRSFKSLSKYPAKSDLADEIKKFTGLAATMYDFIKGPIPPKEIAFYRYLVDDSKALVIGCGTGRLLLALAEHGAEVDGIDPSEDMLTICQKKLLESKTKKPVSLHSASMQDFQLPSKYDTILVPDETFMYIDRKKALEALKNILAHLKPGGRVLIELLMPYANYRNEQIKSFGDSITYQSDEVNVVCKTNYQWNFIRKWRREQQRIEASRNGRVESHFSCSEICLYSIDEFLSILQKVGFVAEKPVRFISLPYGEKIIFQAEVPDFSSD